MSRPYLVDAIDDAAGAIRRADNRGGLGLDVHESLRHALACLDKAKELAAIEPERADVATLERVRERLRGLYDETSPHNATASRMLFVIDDMLTEARAQPAAVSEPSFYPFGTAVRVPRVDLGNVSLEAAAEGEWTGGDPIAAAIVARAKQATAQAHETADLLVAMQKRAERAEADLAREREAHARTVTAPCDKCGHGKSADWKALEAEADRLRAAAEPVRWDDVEGLARLGWEAMPRSGLTWEQCNPANRDDWKRFAAAVLQLVVSQLACERASHERLIDVIAQETNAAGISDTMTPEERVRAVCGALARERDAHIRFSEERAEVERLRTAIANAMQALGLVAPSPIESISAIGRELDDARAEVERLKADLTRAVTAPCDACGHGKGADWKALEAEVERLKAELTAEQRITSRSVENARVEAQAEMRSRLVAWLVRKAKR